MGTTSSASVRPSTCPRSTMCSRTPSPPRRIVSNPDLVPEKPDRVNTFYIGEIYHDIGIQWDDDKPDGYDKSDLIELPLDDNPCGTPCATLLCCIPADPCSASAASSPTTPTSSAGPVSLTTATTTQCVANSEPLLRAFDVSAVEDVVLAMYRLARAATYVETLFADTAAQEWRNIFEGFVLDSDELACVDEDSKFDQILDHMGCLLPC